MLQCYATKKKKAKIQLRSWPADALFAQIPLNKYYNLHFEILGWEINKINLINIINKSIKGHGNQIGALDSFCIYPCLYR